MTYSYRIGGLCLLFLGQFWAGSAFGTTINDNYIGGLYQPDLSGVYHLYPYTDDLVSGDTRYEITKMEVNIGASTKIDIYTNYVNYVTENDNIEYGDLFLSNNGYTPHSPTTSDYYAFGEVWEFALVLDQHNGSTTNGTASLYAVDVSVDYTDYKLADNTGSSVFRNGQEVLFNTSGKPVLATGSWSTFAGGLSFTINTSYLHLTGQDLGLRWAMTCANDVIEGGAPVPEPTTMLLFGTGLAGLAGYRLRKRRP